jgi:hypothetical protein
MKLLKEFAMNLSNNEEIMFTNGLLWFKFAKVNDEIKLYSYASDVETKSLDIITWDYNQEVIPCLYDAYLELLNGYNSSLSSRAYSEYREEIEAVKWKITA